MIHGEELHFMEECWVEKWKMGGFQEKRARGPNHMGMKNNDNNTTAITKHTSAIGQKLGERLLHAQLPYVHGTLRDIGERGCAPGPGDTTCINEEVRSPSQNIILEDF